MQESLDESKKNTKAKLDAIVDEYYKKYKDAGENRQLTINHIEQFLIDNKSEVEKVFKEASTDILKKMEVDMIKKKTHVPVAEKR